MLNKRHNPVATFFIFLTLVGVSKPAKALLVAPNDEVIASIAEKLPQEKKIATSDNAIAIDDRNPSSINADRKLYAEFDLKDSGEINQNWKNSGEIDFNLKDSGELNFNSEDSEDIELDTDLRDSGEIHPDLEDSGSLDPDLEDSGQTISLNVESSTIIAQDNENTVAPNEVEGDGVTPTTEEGQWWWWLPLIIGIPIIAAIIISNGQKKSDREPAVDNVRDLDTGDRGLDVSDTSDRENLSVVGTNIDNVDELDRTIGTTTATGAATTNLVDDRSIDLDIDRSNLENTNPVAEIPSTSVSEFTGYETNLQTGDRSTKLEDDNIALDSTDNVAASGLVANRDLETTDSLVEVETEAVTDRKLDTNTLEPVSNLPIVNSDRAMQDTSDNAFRDEDVEAKEFRGDYVLEEETQGFIPYQETDADLNLTETTQTEEQNNEILVSELDPTRQASSFVEEVSDLNQPDVVVNEIDSDTDIISQTESEELNTNQNIEVVEFDNAVDLDTSDRTNSSDDFTVLVADSQLHEQSAQLQLDSELVEKQNNEILVSEIDSDTDIISETQQTEELDTDRETIEVIGFDSEPYIEPTQTDLDLDEPDPSKNDNLTDNFEVVNISIDEVGFDNADETIETSFREISFDDSNNTSVSLEEISFDDRSSQTIDSSIEISFNDDNIQATDASLNELSFDDDSNQTIDSSTDELSFDESNDTNVSIDEISFDDNSSQTIDSSVDEINFDESNDTNVSFDDNSSQTIDSSIDEISFDDNGTQAEDISLDDSEFDEISFDDDSTQTIDSSVDEISFDDDSTQAEDNSLDDISFDDSEFNEISFDDDSTQAIDSSVDEINFDESNDTNVSFDDNGTQAEDNSLDDISFDDSEFDEISFDDDSTQTIDSSVDEISFDDGTQAKDNSLDDISFDDSEFDEISFDDDSTQNIDASLEEISFDELDEINLDDDSTQNIDASLEEINFDELDRNDSTNKVDDFNSDEVDYVELDKARVNSTSDLLSNSTAGIASLSNDESEDMNNITEWLESLETPQKNTDNILEWLDNLNNQDTNSRPNNREVKSEKTDDISFEFIEDLLNEDPKQEK